MITDFFKKLFRGSEPTPPPAPNQKQTPGKPPIPQEEIDAFKDWFESQTKPAIAFDPSSDADISLEGSRLGGPAWIAEGATWPETDKGVPLEFLFQLDCADCTALDGYPDDTILQFFIGRSDLLGADFDRLVVGDFLVQARSRSDKGDLHPAPPLEEVNGKVFSDHSPFHDMDVRQNGLMLNPRPFTDQIDFNIDGVYDRVAKLADRFDITELESWIETDGDCRPMVHHTGGYPAFTQNDITATLVGKPFDHVLLRLTSDDLLMWGDSGECVFLIRREDLAKGDFSRIAYSWDCC